MNTNFIFILLFAYSGYPIADISYCFECCLLTEPFCYQFVSPTDGSNQNVSRDCPASLLFFFYARIVIGTKVTPQKPTMCSLLSVQQLNH